MERVCLVELGRAEDRLSAMSRDARTGLARAPRSIPPKYFYDDAGSRLFDAICELPEYYLTRSERALLERHAGSIVADVRAGMIVEIGSGMARKTGLLVKALCERADDPVYVPFDIAREAIEASARDLLPCDPRLRLHGVVGDFTRDLPLLSRGLPASTAPRLFAFLGSTIGNLDEVGAPALVSDLRALMTNEDRFLLGVDLVKDERVLHAAYNDASGVTAEFNKNILRVVSRELRGGVDVDAFEHLAFYDATRERIEMHLVSTRRQRITLQAIELDVEVSSGERIHTEISRKFTRASVERTLGQGGMGLERWLPDAEGTFALAVARRT